MEEEKMTSEEKIESIICELIGNVICVFLKNTNFSAEKKFEINYRVGIKMFMSSFLAKGISTEDFLNTLKKGEIGETYRKLRQSLGEEVE